jgi:hypothetical protein
LTGPKLPKRACGTPKTLPTNGGGFEFWGFDNNFRVFWKRRWRFIYIFSKKKKNGLVWFLTKVKN